MNIQVSGYENNRPVLTTYHVTGEPVGNAEACADSGGKLQLLTAGLDTTKQYALMNNGRFFGLIMCADDKPMSAIGDVCYMLTLPSADWESGLRVQVHNVVKGDSILDY